MKTDAQAVLNWLEAVSRGMAKAKKPRGPTTFLFDKSVPPRYKVWKRRNTNGI